ncbi:MAG: pirin family protein [Thiothrix sp.]|nr:MAG: pirin family protein [Thiothrix sp.]
MMLKLLTGHIQDLGGFSVRRLLPHQAQRAVGPWVFFDHLGPAQFAPGAGINVRPHPHINLATVTYLFTGEILHRDSLGNLQAIHPGDLNLMIAGRGIVHSERETEAAKQQTRDLHGLQLWLALPEAAEEVEPEFLHYPSASLPALTLQAVPVRVLIGTAYGVSSPVKTLSPTLYIEADLQAGQNLALPEGVSELGIYVASGQLQLGEQNLDAYTLTALDSPYQGELVAQSASRIAMIGGAPLGKRYMWWNFVSSRKERIEEAKLEWKNRSFPLVPGDEQEFIPLPPY